MWALLDSQPEEQICLSASQNHVGSSSLSTCPCDHVHVHGMATCKRNREDFIVSLSLFCPSIVRNKTICLSATCKSKSCGLFLTQQWRTRKGCRGSESDRIGSASCISRWMILKIFYGATGSAQIGLMY